MHIHQLLEAGKPDYNFDDDMAETLVNRRTLTENIQRIGGGLALEQVLSDPSKLIHRGIRGDSATVFTQNTWTTERRAQNTSNYVNLLSEILPSWHRAGIPARSKAVACSSFKDKAHSYGRLYVVLPTNDSVCVYTGTHDFWNAFEAVNHLYGNTDGNGGIPAINEALDKFAQQHVYPRATSAKQVADMCRQMQEDLDGGLLQVEGMNPELRALFESEPGNHDLLSILDNLLDPSHMKVTKGGNLLALGAIEGGEEIACSGKLIYVTADLFKEVFGLK